jgi:expansin (peptidoglycan-binding protein)
MIECFGYKRIQKGILEGFANITVQKWGIDIYGVAVFNDGAKKWCSLPKKEYKDPEGKTKYSNIIKFKDTSIETKFLQKVMEAINKYNNEMPTQASVHQDELPF